MWASTSEADDEAMNSSTWYIHQRIDIHSLSLLSDRQLTERATWRAALRGQRAKHHK
jgi:hypothetical protein